MSVLVNFYVVSSILALIIYWFLILLTIATIKREYPDYRGNKNISMVEFVFSVLKVCFVCWLPLVNIAIVWAGIFHTNELVNSMVEKVMGKGE